MYYPKGGLTKSPAAVALARGFDKRLIKVVINSSVAGARVVDVAAELRTMSLT
jgi:hypothetical protein